VTLVALEPRGRDPECATGRHDTCAEDELSGTACMKASLDAGEATHLLFAKSVSTGAYRSLL
jgi:hypothetical protein